MSDISTADLRARAFHEYFLYSGSLFFAFGKAETVLAATLRYHISWLMPHGIHPGYPDSIPIAAAVIGSIRFANLRDMFKRLLKFTKPAPELQKYVDDLFKHIGDIQFLRDRLAHNIVEPLDETYDGTWAVHDFATTKDFANWKSHKFDIDALKAAIKDLDYFTFRTMGLLSPWVISSEYPGPYDLSPPTWRYKPSMLAPYRRRLSENPP